MADPRIYDKFIYTLVDRELYEDLSQYVPIERDFRRPLLRILPHDWTVKHRALWWDCHPGDCELPAQGWKIHVSATPAHSPAILMTTARILFERRVPFKFVADRMLLMLICGKNWNRASAGKFITLYPRSEAECGELLEELNCALLGYAGPFILSDRRYKDSRTVYYRYGGFAPIKRIEPNGAAAFVIRDNSGCYVDDERAPSFRLPPGVEDPFQKGEQETSSADEAGTLKHGRYRIESALAHGTAGNVYLGRDLQHDRQVVIKEGRPYTDVTPHGLDAVQLRKKEWRLLKVLEDTDITPKALDFFLDWEHAYLVEEYFENTVTLREHLASSALLLRTRPDADATAKYLAEYRALFSRIAAAVKMLHGREIVFSDLSPKNILVKRSQLNGDLDIKLIDLEGAYEEGVDLPTPLFTPGFSPLDSTHSAATKKDDCYGLGGLLLAGIFPINGILSINREFARNYLQECHRDFGLPLRLVETICRLLSQDPSARPDADEVISVLQDEIQPTVPRIRTQEFSDHEMGEVLAGVTRYIKTKADFSRRDRLFPADPAVFQTNPLGLSHGACGVAHVLHRIHGRVDVAIVQWILSHQIRGEAYPPGLFSGLAGIAWTLMDLELRDQAIEVLERSADHHLLWRSPDLFHGAAGWGMAQLHFFSLIGDERYLSNAVLAGRFLMESRHRESASGADAKCFWTSEYGVSASLGHGVAGICLFLLYLFLATDDEEYLKVGEQGLEWVLDQGVRNAEGGLTWKVTEGVPSYTPYLRWGSAGIGRSLLRYWHVTRAHKYEEALAQIAIECDRKYTIFPGYHFGLAGICELFLDMSRFERWAKSADGAIRRLLSGCLLFKLTRDAGIAFPGESLNRISCDLGTGSSGVALVLHRFRTQGEASFMSDELIPGWSGRIQGTNARIPCSSAVPEIVNNEETAA
jgi:class III lanthionine synthetase